MTSPDRTLSFIDPLSSISFKSAVTRPLCTVTNSEACNLESYEEQLAPILDGEKKLNWEEIQKIEARQRKAEHCGSCYFDQLRLTEAPSKPIPTSAELFKSDSR